MVRLEQSNRDTLSLLDAKSTSHDKLTEELSTQHQKIVNLRRETSSLEERIQTAENSLSGARFRESSLQQEIELLKRNNEWFEAELKTKSSEYSKYRKEKGARITELQRLNEDASATVESLKRTEGTLRKRLEELVTKTEETLARIHSMQDDAARAKEAFRAELDNSRRLADLHKQGVDTARRRVQELDQLLEQTKEDAAEEISQVQSELETERQSHEAAETRVEQLEAELEKIATEAVEQQQQSTLPGTPRRHMNGLNATNTPMRTGSPSFSTPGSSRNRGGLSMTQMYADYTSIKAELDMERRRNEKLTTTIDDMIRDLEKKEPELQELQMEHARLDAEVTQLATLLSKAGQEKDTARKESRKFEGQIAGLQRESDLLRQQLRDHSAQIKILLLELHSRQDGVELSPAERAEFERIARAELSETALEGMSDTGRFISQRLTTFRNVSELQERNAQLLHLTRQLGERMEGDEAKAQKDQQEKDHLELESLRERVERYKDEIKSLVTQSQSYIRERDMFRRMLAHRGQLPPGDLDANFGSSINAPATPRTPQRSGGVPNGGSEDSETAKQLADYAKLIKELQSHFDAYRQESATDLTTYKTQVTQLAKEKGDLQGDIARASSQVTLAQERHDMLQANYQLLKTENSEHQKRVQSYAEIAAKQDIRTQQVAEELIDARGLAESMRNDIANLKAEKELWKKIESRLREDNQSLAEEKAKLNKIVTDTQNLANERELSDSEIRRRLQNQVESLESEMRVVKRKLDEEVDEAKKNSMRREYEAEQSRKRIDDLVASLGNVKEELATTRTLRDQYQARVEELKMELRNAVEREQALRPRPTPRAESTMDMTAEVSAEEDALTREQELGIEVADLKGELHMANSNLEAARAQVEQYKAISQSSEEELQSLNDSQDQYRDEIERIISEKETKVQELAQRVDDIMSELTTTNTQLSEARTSAEDITSRLDQQQSAFKVELAAIKEESENYVERAKLYQEDLKAQADIAQQAQQSYENELLKHAEAAKALQKVRIDFNQVKLELSEARADAEAARTTLAQSEESWQSTRDRYELELTEIKTRHHEIDAQNKILHQQLENVGSQITGLQQTRAHANAENEAPNTPDSSLHNLQEVIKYLRREKEIIDVQYELSVQEAKRLRQQLDYSQTQLDDSRLKLEQERQRQNNQERSSISHSKLMETINELNVFRESTVTLRNEARQAQKQLAEKSAQVDELIAQIQPLQTTVRELENERETSQGERKLLEEDRNRWQQRTANILQKYDRVDPAELEGLKAQIASLSEERDEVILQKQSLQERVDQVSGEVEKAVEERDKLYEERRLKLVDQFKSRSRELSGKINAAGAETKAVREELDSVKGELESANVELASVKSELETARTALETASSKRVEALSNVEAAQARIAQLEAAHVSNTGPEGSGIEEGQVDEGVHVNGDPGMTAAVAEAQDRARAAELNAQQHSARADQLQEEVTSLQNEVVELEDQVNNLQGDLSIRNSQISALQLQATTSDAAGSAESLEKLKQDLAAAQGEVELLKINATNPASSVQSTIADSLNVSANTDVATQVATIKEELEKAYQEKIQQEVDRYNQRAASMKSQLSAKLAEGKTKFREDAEKEREEALQNLRIEHEAAVQKLNTSHEATLIELNAQHSQEIETLQNRKSSPALTAQPDLAQANAAPTTVAEEAAPTPAAAEASLSQKQVQAILSTNQFARDILLRNIKTKLEQQAVRLNEEHDQALQQKLAEARTKQEEILKEEHERSITQKVEELTTVHEKSMKEKLDEVMANFQKTKEQAISLESKKWTVKISMLEGRNRAAIAKIEVFQKAAEETPQKPVFEVWAIAKDMKAPPAPIPPPVGTQSLASLAFSARPTPVSRPVPTTTQDEASTPAHVVTAQPSTQTPQIQAATPAQPIKPATLTTATARPAAPTVEPAVAAMSPVNVPAPGQAAGTGSTAQQDGAAAVRPSQHQGTGPAALRGMLTQGSGIPRGGGIPRPGRGGIHNLPPIPQGGLNIKGGATAGQRGGDWGRSRGGAQHSPGRSPGGGGGGGGGNALNVAARQFIPGGNKRPREGSDGGPDGLAGKRPRGGGPDGN